jgi:predicted RecA/RadA family phage recombinase
MAQTPAALVTSDGDYIDYTPGSAVTAGDVVELGSIPLVAARDIAASALGALHCEGVYDVPKTSDTFTAGDAVYWDNDANPVTGTAGSGAADAVTGNLMGVAIADAATGDSYVRVKLTAAKRTTTIAGSVTADDITATDSSLAISGLAAAQGGAIAMAGGTSSTSGNAGGAITVTGGTPGATGVGGAVTVVGGAGGATSGTGGAATLKGGAGTNGNAVGGAALVTGGAGNGTGTGGAVTITAGASGAGATGNGGAITITGGAAGSTNGNGGSVTLVPGALAGTGAPGSIALTGFTKMFVAQTIAMSDAAVTLTRVPGTPTGTLLTGNWLLVDAESGTSENLLLPPEADCTNALLLIKNTGGETINLQNDAAGALATIATGETCFAQCDGTTWTVMQHVFTT